jgi:hypothetical protein
MTPSSTRLVAIVVGCLCGAMVTPTEACAQESPSTASVPWTPLTSSQLAALSTLVNEPVPTVVERLLADPGMIPMALEADEARARRQRQGRMLATLGGGTFAAGVALAIWAGISWSDYHPTCTVAEDGGGCSEINLAPAVLLIGLVGAGGGVVVGGIGIYKLGTLSVAEDALLRRYRPAVWPGTAPSGFDPPSDSFVWKPSSVGRGLHVSLLSFRF